MIVRMQQRRGAQAQWTAANPILAEGEIGYDTTYDIEKIGDGIHDWYSLPYRPAPLDISAVNRGAAPTYTSGSSHIWIPGMMIAVPPTLQDITVEWQAATGISIAGEGVVSTYLYELTGGAPVIRGNCAPQRFESNVLVTLQGPTHLGRAEVGASSIARIFALYIGAFTATASALQSYVFNGAADYNRTILKARG